MNNIQPDLVMAYLWDPGRQRAQRRDDCGDFLLRRSFLELDDDDVANHEGLLPIELAFG
jgi:hypothetical protein